MSEFPFKTKPFKHQLDCWDLSKDREEFALFMEMGTGKSKVIIDTSAHLYLSKRIQAHVIVAPKGVYRNWQEGEVPMHLPSIIKNRVAAWSSHMLADERKALADLYQEGDDLRTLLINVEALNSERAVDELIKFMEKYACMMTIDESTTIKSQSAKRTKIATNIGKYAKFRRICSGNPIPNGPIDLYTQSEFLKKGITGFPNFYSFRNRFSVMQQVQLRGKKPFQQIVGYRDMDKLKQIMRRFSFIIKKEECLDLPKKLYQTIDVEMGPKQKAAYNEMLNECYVTLNQGECTAQMVITQLMRLHQIACGYIKVDNGPEVPFDEPNDRLNTLIEQLEQAPGKVIIWANYRYNIKQIISEISRIFGPQSVVHYYGDTSEEDRGRAKRLFQDTNSSVRFIVSNPDTGKFGNTWTQATTVIYYSNSYNLESREQSEDRAHRIGQEGFVFKGQDSPAVLYIDLQVRGTVDQRIVSVLKKKKKLTDEIVESNWKWLIGEQI